MQNSHLNYITNADMDVNNYQELLKANSMENDSTKYKKKLFSE